MVGNDAEDFAKDLNCQNWRVGACTEMGDFLRQYGICSALNNKSSLCRSQNQKLLAVCMHALATDNILASIKAHQLYHHQNQVTVFLLLVY